MVQLRATLSPNLEDDYIIFGAEAVGDITAGATVIVSYSFDTEIGGSKGNTSAAAGDALSVKAKVDMIDWLVSGTITYTAPGQPTISHHVDFDRAEGSDSVIDIFLPYATASTVNLKGGDDIFFGGAGNDRVTGGKGADYLDGGTGSDTLNYFVLNDYNNQGVVIDLYHNTASGGDATGDTIRNFENVLGTTLNDVIRGTSGDNILMGYIGNDSLYGGKGNDQLGGGGGADRIEGGAGSDTITTGTARDTIVYKEISDSTRETRDTITDFNKDIIHLSYIDADASTGGNQAFHFIGAGPFTGEAGELRLSVNTAGNYLIVYGDVDGNQSADFAVKVLGVTTLAASDFVL